MRTFLLSVCAVLLIAAASFALYRYVPPDPSAIQYEDSKTTTNVRISSSVAYFAVKQDKPGKVCVRKLSGFYEAMVAQPNGMGHIINIVPCGPAVNIDGELAYQAMFVTYTPR